MWTDVLDQCQELYVVPTVPKNTHKVDAILYINLAHRQDRRRQIEETIASIRFLTNHVERIDAVRHVHGGKGCGLSHLKAFERILESSWETVLILEDDAELDMNPRTFAQKLKQALLCPFDVVVCGSEYYDASSMDKMESDVVPVTDVQCTASYLIRRSYVPVLQTLWTFCVDKLGSTMNKQTYRQFSIDQGWKQLFPFHKWMWLTGNAFRQRQGYSDIEQRVVRYDKWHPRRNVQL